METKTYLDCLKKALVYSAFYEVDGVEYSVYMKVHHYSAPDDFELTCVVDGKHKFRMINPPIDNDAEFIEYIKQNLKEEL